MTLCDFYVIVFFWKDRTQSEGKRYTRIMESNHRRKQSSLKSRNTDELFFLHFHFTIVLHTWGTQRDLFASTSVLHRLQCIFELVYDLGLFSYIQTDPIV